MKYFVICAVRDADEEYNEFVRGIVDNLEYQRDEVHWPTRDTDQNDNTGYGICIENRAAIANADKVLFIWDGESKGSLFDLGIAWGLGKQIIVVPYYMPPIVPGQKSFQSMVAVWENIGAYGHPPFP